jgi:predicted metalloprotease with PDZ domain
MKTAFLIILLILGGFIYAQDNTFYYEVDLVKKNDSFNVTLSVPQLTEKDNIYSFVSYAPGVHQPLDFGRFIKMFKVYDSDGNELLVNKISTNDFKILEPVKVSKIVYEIDDSFDMSGEYHPIYPMSGTGINKDYTILNPHGVFGYFRNLKNNPVEFKLKVEGNPKIGTALNKNDKGNYTAESYYQLTDSPVLIGEKLTYASTMIDEIKVEAYVYSPSGKITAQQVLDQSMPILNAAKNFMGYSPVNRYTFLMYFSSRDEIKEMPVLGTGGALEHSFSSTYALPDIPEYLPFLNNIVAHEYMHILCPLHLHSNVLANFDYSKPVSEDKHVWLYEGVTEWVSYAMQLKSGLVTFDDYLDFLSKKINNSMQYDSSYSLLRISREWSTDEGNKQYGNIYQLGALTAAMLDIKLLRLSNGTRSLRDVYLELIKKYGKENPFDNDTFFDTLVAMTYPEIKDFINDHIKRNTPFNFKEEMKSIGVNYYEKRLNPDSLATTGMNIQPDNSGRFVLVSLNEDYKGSVLKREDIISAINGQELNSSTVLEILDKIKKMKIGEEYQLDIIRNGKSMKITEKLYPKHDKNVFETDPDASPEEIALREMISTFTEK